MTRPIAFVLVLVVAVAGLFLWLRSGEPAPGAIGSGTAGPGAATEAAAGGLAPEVAVPGIADDTTARADVTPKAPDPTPFAVRGLVLADNRRPDLGDLRVVAYRGEATDESSMFMRAANQRGRAPAAVLTGEPIASAAVDTLGNFELRTAAPHLRLTVEHPLYTMAAPEFVHVPSSGAVDDVVLAPILGARLRGRLFGARAGAIDNIRVVFEPNPAMVMRDMPAFIGAMLSLGRLHAAPGPDLEFDFQGLIPGSSITLNAEGDGAFATSTQPALQPGETREVALPVQAAASLRVTVVDEQELAIAGARVNVRPTEGAPSMLPMLRNRGGRTDDAGICTIRSLEPTRVRVETQAVGYTFAVTTLDLTVDPTPQELRLTLHEGGIVTGTVRAPDGTPLPDAHVAHQPSAELPVIGDMAEQLGATHLAEAAMAGVATAEDGSYRLSGLADEGEFLVIAAHPGYGASYARGVHMGDAGVDIVLSELGAIRGSVVAAEDDAPLPEFTVRVLKTMFLFINAPVHEEQVHGGDGAFALTSIPTGSYTLEVNAEGRSTETMPVEFRDGGVDVGVVRMRRGAIASGIVQDENGTPIRGAVVRRQRGAMADNPMMSLFGGASASVRTDRDGRFTLGPLPARRMQLIATANGYASGSSERFEAEEGTTREGIVISLGHGGAITGVLRPGAGNRVQDFLVMAQHQPTMSTATADVDLDGTFRFDNLDPGPYVVQAMPNDFLGGFSAANHRPGQGVDLAGMIQQISSQTVSQRCTVRAGETSEVELDAGELLIGTRWHIAVEVGGKPMTSGILEATSTASGRLRAVFFQDGAAVLGNVEPGAYEVRIRSGIALAPVGEPQLLEFPREAAEHSSRLSLPGGELRGRVVDADTGKPLRAALVRLLDEQNAAKEDLFGVALTDAEGGFVFSGLADGSYGVIAIEHLTQSEGAASQRGIRVTGGTTEGPVELRARPAATASVVVTTPNGAPVVGATVLCVDAEGRPLSPLGIASTDAAGRAWFGGMPKGRARVVGRAPGLAPGASEIRDVDPTAPCEFLLALTAGAHTTIQAIDGDGHPIEGAQLTARCNDGPWLPAMLLVERSGQGRYELGRLSPGTWDFRLSHPGIGTLVQRRVIGNEPAVTVLVTPQ